MSKNKNLRRIYDLMLKAEVMTDTSRIEINLMEDETKVEIEALESIDERLCNILDEIGHIHYDISELMRK